MACHTSTPLPLALARAFKELLGWHSAAALRYDLICPFLDPLGAIVCICSLRSALLRILHLIRANRGHLASGDSICVLYRCIGMVICLPPVDNGQWKLFGSIRSGLSRSGSPAAIPCTQKSTDFIFFTYCTNERLGLHFCLSGGLISPFVRITHPEHLHYRPTPYSRT